MLGLIIAKPRTGKSQYAVSLGLEAKKQGKRVFVTNFNQTPEQRQQSGFEEWPDATTWWNDMPHGSVWIVDEAHEIFRQRDKSTPLPDFVQKLSLHGHHDLTIYLITQDGSQLDVHCRRTANHTFHLSRPLGLSAAKVYTFNGYQEMPNDAWRRSQVLKTAESSKRFKYSSKYQDLYVSASAHDHVKKRLPKKLLILPIAALIVLGLLLWVYLRLTSQANDTTNPATAAVAAAVTGAEAPTAAARGRILTVAEYQEQWTERVEGLPWSAPAYDGFQVQDYPRPYCIISGTPDASRCRCYTQQATRLDTPDQLCRSYVENGLFDPYRNPNQQQQQQQQQQAPAQQPTTPVAATSVIGYQQGGRGDIFPRSPGYEGSKAGLPTL